MFLLAIAAFVAFAAALLPFLYTYVVPSLQADLPRLHNKRICLLIAHPDDEAMFFAPSVLALTRPETGNHVKILCLSSGNADGLGETRKKELVKSGMLLGLRQEDDVFVVENPEFPDSMTASWDPTKISSLLCDAFAPHSKSSSPSARNRPTANIDVLVTFDATGVSSHPNHISLYKGARAFIATLLRGKPGHASPVDLYTLTSVPIFRKYTSILDALPTLAASWSSLKAASSSAGAGNSEEEDATAKEQEDEKDGQHPASLVFFNSLFANDGAALPVARKAMTTAHKSQMVWFRWGWITMSRYMVINDLQLERVEPAAEP